MADLVDGGSSDAASVELVSAKGTFIVITPCASDEAALLLTVRRFDARLLGKLVETRIARAERRSRLSPREREVLRLLLRGYRIDDAARRLRIAPRTVKFHRANILMKLGADSRFDLLRVLLP